MNKKAKGNRNERRSRNLYKAAGYTVIKAGASLGAFDLVAWNSKEIHYIQVKTRDWPGKEEKANMLKVVIPFNGKRFMHRYRKGISKPDIKELN